MIKKLSKDFASGFLMGIFFSFLVNISTVEGVIIMALLTGLIGILAGLPVGNSTSDFRTKYRPG